MNLIISFNVINDARLFVQMRRSIFGYFCRRCFVSFLKLSFSGVVELQKNYQSWCAGDPQAGYEPVVKDQLNNGIHTLASA
jgi:hypothetical protein